MSDGNASCPAPPPMADNDTPTAHPTTGGKGPAAYERPRYKSWRKKFRKMHADFDAKHESNRTFFKEEQRLAAVAKRLREQINGLLEICLDLNANPSIPPELRFDVSPPNPLPTRVSSERKWIPPTITPEEANARIMEYNLAVRQGKIPPLDLVEVRAQIDAQLAAQGIQSLEELEKGVSQPVQKEGEADAILEGDLSFMPFDHEMDYLTRLDATLSHTGGIAMDPRHRDIEQERHLADLTPRELERKTEFENPQSQHNWLKTHTKVLAGTEGGDGDDTESLASHDAATGSGNSRKRKPANKLNLAKQVGDRAVERAREGSTAAFSNDEDELAASDGGVGVARPGSGSGKKRQRDADGAYRLKGASKSAAKGKRKRTGEDLPEAGGAGGGKKAKVEGGSSAGTPTSNGTGAGGSGVMGMG